MKIRILAVGKLKEQYLKKAIGEYTKRLSRFSQLEIIEVNDEACSANASIAQEEIVKAKEGQRLLAKIKPTDYVYLLDVSGKMVTSKQLADSIQTTMTAGKSTIDFVIGGSLGHSPEMIARADQRISISKMTFPHQIVRVLVLEQIYRCFKINNNETYHK